MSIDKSDSTLVLDSACRASGEPSAPVASAKMCLCVLQNFREGVAMLEVPGQNDLVPVFASICALDVDQLGQVFAVGFAEGDIKRPIVMGIIVDGIGVDAGISKPVNIHSDSEISLKCGKASLTLKSDGTIAIRGTNVASRATHTNRIRGGNVQIN